MRFAVHFVLEILRICILIFVNGCYLKSWTDVTTFFNLKRVLLLWERVLGL